VISRRRFLRRTLVGGALLGLGGVVLKHLSGYALDPAVARSLRAFSPKEFLVFDAVARRIVAPDGPDAPAVDARVALFADGYVAKLPEQMRGDIRALLQLVEHGGFLFRLRGTRFTRLGAEELDAALAEWESSALAVRRQGFQALRTLAFLGYWRDDRAWPLIGYTGPMLPRRPL
jgi:hypothetical protein